MLIKRNKKRNLYGTVFVGNCLFKTPASCCIKCTGLSETMLIAKHHHVPALTFRIVQHLIETVAFAGVLLIVEIVKLASVC